MNYEKKYEDYYSKSFDRMELMIKNFFVKRRSRKRFFVDSINEVTRYFNNEFKNKYNFHNNNDLKNINLTFHNRFSAYSSDATKEILENDIKTAFDKIQTAELPACYDYVKFIKEMAVIEAAKEIARVLTVNSSLLDMLYKLNQFEEFEVRDYVNSTLDASPIFRKYHRLAHPDYYMYKLENVGNSSGNQKKIEINFLGQPTNAKANELFEYFIQYYRPDEISSVKFINILHYLKNDVNKELYTFKLNQQNYKEMILTKKGIEIKKFAKSERYNEDERPILNSLERSFQKH